MACPHTTTGGQSPAPKEKGEALSCTRRGGETEYCIYIFVKVQREIKMKDLLAMIAAEAKVLFELVLTSHDEKAFTKLRSPEDPKGLFLQMCYTCSRSDQCSSQKHEGGFFKNGIGGIVDRNKGVDCFRQAVNQGNAVAVLLEICCCTMCTMSSMRWEGMHQNLAVAVGTCFLQGTGVQEDMALGIEWNRKPPIGDTEKRITLGNCSS